MNTKRILFVSLVVVLMLGSLLVASSCQGGKEGEKVFKFASLTPLSGAWAEWGFPIQYSLEIAVEDINAAGGIKVGDDYYKIEMVTYDNVGDPTVTASAARKAIYDDGIKYLFVTTTDQAAAINELCNDEKVLLFCDGPYRNYIGPQWPYSFQCWFEFVESEGAMLDYIQQKYPQYKRVAIMCSDDDRGHTAADDFKQFAPSRGFEVVDVIFTEAETTDYYSVLTQLLQKGVDIIDVDGHAFASQGYIEKQARELGFKGIFIHPDTLSVPVVSDIAGIGAIEGDIGATQLIEMPADIGKSWADQFTQKYGSFEYWPSFKYDTLLLLKAAIEKANTFDTEKVMDELGKVTVNGLSGPVSFGVNKFTGGIPRSIKLKMYVVQVQNGELVEVYSGFSPLWQ